MPIEMEFLSPSDKPALLALSTPEYLAAAKTVLAELEYKVHVAANHEEFLTRFAQVQYQVVILEEIFAGQTREENLSLDKVQGAPMGQRRHAVVFLIGPNFQTMNGMQGFRQSVHGVINPAELGSLKQIVQQVVADNNLFLHVYRDTQARLAQGK